MGNETILLIVILTSADRFGWRLRQRTVISRRTRSGISPRVRCTALCWRQPSADLEVRRRRTNMMHLRIRIIENRPVQSAPHS
jgi:hypothetical protein